MHHNSLFVYIDSGMMDGMNEALEIFKAVQLKYPEAFFFETAGIDTQKKKLTVIGLGPFETIRRRRADGRDCVEKIQDGQCVELQQSFFVALTELAAQLDGDGREAFAKGGIFGCLGFDCVRELEPSVGRTGVKKSLEQEVTAEVMLVRNLILFDHISNKISFRGELTEQIYNHAMSGAPRKNTAVPSELRSKTELPPERFKSSLGYKEFRECVASLREHIRAGDIFQAVLAERFECTTPISAIDIFSELYGSDPAAYTFFFSFSSGEFLGASPEALLKVEEGRMITHPIAGTKPRGGTPAHDRALAKNLRASRKEGAEHLMLVDLARNDIGRVAKAGSVRVNFFRTLKKFSNVMHLVSEVEGVLDSSQSPLDALEACFPAGTLSGAPKIRAMQLLSKLEKVDRGLYGGAVIALDPAAKFLESCIAIRCMEKKGDLAILRAGAGIVADSKPELEYAEISHKLRSVRQALAAAELRPARALVKA